MDYDLKEVVGLSTYEMFWLLGLTVNFWVLVKIWLHKKNTLSCFVVCIGMNNVVGLEKI